MQKRIRFGIMCSGTIFPKWQADTIVNLLKIKEIVPGLLIVNKSASPKGYRKIFSYLKINKLLWILYMFYIKGRLKSSKRVDLSKHLKHFHKIECQTVRKGKFSNYFYTDDIQKIREYQLDFILRFDFGIIRGDILNAARYGIWSFHHDDEEKYRGAPPCFWEIYHDDKVTAAVLQRLTEKLDSGVILYKGYLKTETSYVKNRDQLFFESSKWPSLLCIYLLNNNPDRFNNPPSLTNAPVYTVPNNWQFVIFFLKSIYIKLKEFNKWFFYVNFWNIGIAYGHISSFLSDQKPEVKWFPLKSKKIFLADPFAVCDVENANKLHIFFEAFDFRKRKGIIQYTCFDKEFSPPVTVIEELNHLSYPYILQNGDEVLIIPECFESKTIALYKAKSFPYEWRKNYEMIKDFKGVDNTIIQRNGKYWMFTSDKREGVPYNLKIFFADTLNGKWNPHPNNPVKSDIRSSRSAGTPFEYNSSLYRPSMDNSEMNEGRIVINKITKLTTTEYEEVSVKTVYPYKDSFFSDKIHTICSSGEYTIIDGAKRVHIFSDWHLLVYKLKTLIEKFH